MSRKVLKVVYKCFLCPNIVREKDAFETKYIADVSFNAATPPIKQESKVMLCRTCMENAGYLSKRGVKRVKIDKNTKNMFPEEKI
jgi:hypothetical protein